MPKLPKYHFFSDDSMKRRMTTVNVFSKIMPGPMQTSKVAAFDDLAITEDASFAKPQVTGRVKSGWDKYFYYSEPADKSTVHRTARAGRSRPAVSGPRTFRLANFTEDQMEGVSNHKGGMANTTYAMTYGILGAMDNELRKAVVPQSHKYDDGPPPPPPHIVDLDAGKSVPPEVSYTILLHDKLRKFSSR